MRTRIFLLEEASQKYCLKVDQLHFSLLHYRPCTIRHARISSSSQPRSLMTMSHGHIREDWSAMRLERSRRKGIDNNPEHESPELTQMMDATVR